MSESNVLPSGAGGPADSSRIAATVARGEGVAPLPLSAAACLAVARALLASGNRSVGSLAADFRACGGRDPAVADFLGGFEGVGGRGALAAALRAGLAAARGGGVVGGAGGDAEAGILGAVADAVAGSDAMERRFDEAVAAARLEALREFAYGAGHEINNPLANITTRAQALLLDESDPERRRRLAAIVDQAFRARDMIGGLMVFARPPKPVREAVSVETILATVIEAVRSFALAREARLECSAPPSPLGVFVDPSQVAEALRLLVVNALEAVAAGGRVTLAARRGDDGTGCEVVVSDDGRGMDADTLRRSFDPFFSGREAGRGIGLGLPKAWRLLTLSGGSVVVESRPGHGSRVVVRLPGVDAQPGPIGQPADSPGCHVRR